MVSRKKQKSSRIIRNNFVNVKFKSSLKNKIYRFSGAPESAVCLSAVWRKASEEGWLKYLFIWGQIWWHFIKPQSPASSFFVMRFLCFLFFIFLFTFCNFLICNPLLSLTWIFLQVNPHKS